ncbi:PIN domain-containing protein [Oceanotoga sp. DSM 15011]|uniref:PIN domain-containing protein n=1 Tax=Oceanotoga sp. DSM 15011 TaxID=2984951 RepID=UPI0021F4DDE3|nr:PIN domain-containing protein [Oceanotoga sp. DSM 15011]UYP01277.1 PIN domain-containing protein [Oceanotoga sp. DSM 15011]
MKNITNLKNIAKKSTPIILDTNSLINNLNNCKNLIENYKNIIIPFMCIEELEKLKSIPQTHYIAQKIIKVLNKYYEEDSIIFTNSYPNLLPVEYQELNPDNLILSVCLNYKKKNLYL